MPRPQRDLELEAAAGIAQLTGLTGLAGLGAFLPSPSRHPRPGLSPCDKPAQEIVAPAYS